MSQPLEKHKEQIEVSSYIVLARKWRPAQFSDIVGQQTIVQTFINALALSRVHQAYLLTGSRGIGKTTIARIFAKAVRCENLKEGICCEECPPCREMIQGNSLDVLEIDGASHNGVDAVRELRENARFLPALGQKKIYIIDEVHMLSTAAFNALLKTLEEPPPHVLFIFATTEPQKIPITILSRCQRFDLRRVSQAQMHSRLSFVAEKEGIEVDQASLVLITRAAEGSMRDALSLLDQVISFSGKKITVQSVRESIGLIESQTLLTTLRGILERKPLNALAMIEQVFQQGHDLRVFTKGLIDFIHAIILAQLGAPQSSTLEYSEEEVQELKSLSLLRTLEELELIFQILHYGMDWVARSPQPKTVLDVLVIKCATAESLVKAENLNPPPAQVVPQETSAKNWEDFITFVKKTRPLLASLLEHGASPSFSEALSNDTVTILYPPEAQYFKDQLQSKATHDQLLGLGKEYFLKPIRIRVEILQKSTDTMGESIAQRKERELKEQEVRRQEKADQHPLIKEAKSLFGVEHVSTQ